MKTKTFISLFALVSLALAASGCARDAVAKTAEDAGYTIAKAEGPVYESEKISSLRCDDDAKTAFPMSGPDKYGHIVPFTVCCVKADSCYVVERF